MYCFFKRWKISYEVVQCGLCGLGIGRIRLHGISAICKRLMNISYLVRFSQWKGFRLLKRRRRRFAAICFLYNFNALFRQLLQLTYEPKVSAAPSQNSQLFRGMISLRFHYDLNTSVNLYPTRCSFSVAKYRIWSKKIGRIETMYNMTHVKIQKCSSLFYCGRFLCKKVEVKVKQYND